MVKIIVTGAGGFLGRHLMVRLQAAGYDPFPVSSDLFDLRREDDTKNLLMLAGRPDIVFHLAAHIGGIGANRLHPGEFFYDNMQMGLNIIHYARLAGVGKLIMVGTTCSYPKLAPIPFLESGLFDGYPEETNAPYGIAKRALWTMLKAYQDEYGLRYAYLVPTNMFGPGDNFDDSTSHVIPALIKKCLAAKAAGADKITVWGTGNASRDFVYVDDVARALVLAMEKYDRPEPVNLGSGQETRIATLVHFIKETTGYSGGIEYDASKPDGQPRRRLSTSWARDCLGWTATTSLKDGLKKTLEWYLND